MKESKSRRKHWKYVTGEVEPDGKLPFVGYESDQQAAKDLLELYRFNRMPVAKSLKEFVYNLSDDGFFTMNRDKYLQGMIEYLDDFYGDMPYIEVTEDPETGEITTEEKGFFGKLLDTAEMLYWPF